MPSLQFVSGEPSPCGAWGTTTSSGRGVGGVSVHPFVFRVIEATDGNEGIGLHREHRPTLGIPDIVMPEKDGIETVREILAIDPAGAILTMSGRDVDFQEVAIRLGARRGSGSRWESRNCWM